MGKCEICKKKIMYNKYKKYRGKVLCLECYSTRLERKAAKKVIRRRKARKIVVPTEKAEKAIEDMGITLPEKEDEPNETSD